jgi:hypothetical protein
MRYMAHKRHTREMTKDEAIAWFVEARDRRLAVEGSISQRIRLALAALTTSDWQSLGLSEQDAIAMMAALENCDGKVFSRIVGAPFMFRTRPRIAS